MKKFASSVNENGLFYKTLGGTYNSKELTLNNEKQAKPFKAAGFSIIKNLSRKYVVSAKRGLTAEQVDKLWDNLVAAFATEGDK